ncbi:hypothetical protein KW798_03160 [Candidatus Parcubacteria bacterium]|nr:hypothetical protein [Candidatus Parcubacteria bacterium]
MNRGFIALISVLIISAVLLALVLSVSFNGLSSRFALLDIEHKIESQKLAEGCVQTGIIVVANDSLRVVTNRLVKIGKGQCMLTVSPSTPVSGKSQIDATASSSDAATNLRVTLDSSTASVLSWSER